MKSQAEIVDEVRAGPLRVDIRRYSDGRYGFEWRGDAGNDRRQIRVKSLRAAKLRARELADSSKAGTVDILRIDPAEYAEFLRWKAEHRTDISVPDLVKRFMASKETKGRSVKTIRGLRYTLESFAEAFPCQIHQLHRLGVEAWLDGLKRSDGQKLSPRRWNNMLSDIVALIRFGRRDGAVSVETTSVERIERKRISHKVDTYTPAELERLLNACWKEWRPVIIFGAFCGLRPEEICPEKESGKQGIRWEHVLWDKGKVDVPKEIGVRSRRRRFAVLTDAARAWLEPWRDAKGPVAFERRFWHYLPQLKLASGVEWKFDALRHSYASYRLALIKDVQQLAMEMGNSPSIIFRHYLSLKHEDEAEKWFGIRPKSGTVCAKNGGRSDSTE